MRMTEIIISCIVTKIIIKLIVSHTYEKARYKDDCCSFLFLHHSYCYKSIFLLPIVAIGSNE